MNRTQCEEHKKIIQNMGWYLGVSLDIPTCNRVACLGDSCPQIDELRKSLSKKLLDTSLTEEDREKVKKEHAKSGMYSFFNSAEIDKYRGTTKKRINPYLTLYDAGPTKEVTSD